MRSNNNDLVNSLINESVKTLIISALEEQNIEDLNGAHIIYCKDCKHSPVIIEKHEYWVKLEFPDNKCPCRNDDGWHNWTPKDDWFCGNGERKEE